MIESRKTYPPEIDAHRAFLLAHIADHWNTVRHECTGRPPSYTRARIERAATAELSILHNALLECERYAKFSIVIDRPKSAPTENPRAEKSIKTTR